MPYISNSDLESRVKAARKRREQEEDAFIKGATEVAGWETGTTNAEAAAEEERIKNRSNWNKFTDTAKAVGSGIASTYKSLGETLGTIASAPGMNKTQKEHEERQKTYMKQMSDIVKERFPENGPPLAETDPERDAKLKKQFDITNSVFKEGQDDLDWWNDKVENLSVKRTAGDVASVTADVLSAGTYGAVTKGAKTGRILRAGTSPVSRSVARQTIKGAGTGAAINAGTDLTLQQLDEEEGTDLKRLAISGGLGAVLGGVSGGTTQRGMNKAAARLDEADRAVTSGVDESIDSVAASLDADDAARKALEFDPTAPRQIDAGQGRIERRIAEIDEELDGLRKGETDPNAYSTNPEDIRSLEGEKVGRLNKQGTYGETRGATIADSSDTATRARELMRERSALQKEAEGLSSIDRFDGAAAPKIDVEDPQFAKAVDNELEAVDNAMPAPEFKDKQTGKVNALVDYFRTPTKVLQKIGLKDTAEVVEGAFTKYRQATLQSNNLIRDWSKRVGGSEEASRRIFQYLDGDKNIRLQGNEKAVAEEMRAQLTEWADKLNLPQESRVTDYITHIFEGDLKGKSNDVTLNAILESKGTRKTYNPFTQKRLGNKGYKEDAFAAMDAYMKKGNRQLHMDPALKVTADAAKNVDDRTARYLLKLNQSIAMKPDRLEQIINDVVSSIPGVESKFGNQGGTRLMRGWRNTVYRATLGMNVGSALRNLTQGTNTFAELGTRRTLQGYSKLVRTMGEHVKGESKAWDELVEQGVFGDAFHQQDRTYTALSKGLKKADQGLWAMFDFAEKINRGSAYFAAKSKAMAPKGGLQRGLGMTEEQAIEYAKDVVGKTQFRFNDIETPLILRSQAAKTLGQFQSFNIKQAEFLGGKALKAAKGDTMEMYKLARWVGANIAIASSVGTLLGLKWHDAIPDFGTFRGVRSPILEVGKNVKSLVTGKNEYGQEESRADLAKGAAEDMFGLTFPGGTQIKKTKEGLEAVDRGDSRTDSGKIRYTVPDDPATRIRAGLFGQYNLDEGQEFFDKGRQAFSEKQTEVIDAAPSGEEQAYEQMFRNMSEKLDSKLNTGNKIKEEIKNKNFAKAKRLADEHNAAVERELADLSGKVGRPSKDIVDYIRSTYKVNFDYYKRKRD